ncbi:ClpXP protease specificity-enhancing factor [Gammaproteobacteria bacterium]|nr:ClpXP protease specificity-enhancing factor [Gammaproteobacteria bacterium]
MSSVMSSSRPYLLRALYDWVLANNCTPYISVNAFFSEVEVPQDYVREGIIILNISPQAIEDLTLGEAAVSFEGRFGGMPSRVYVPIGAIISIYAKENGKGMVFEMENEVPPPTDPASTSPTTSSRSLKPDLKIVK